LRRGTGRVFFRAYPTAKVYYHLYRRFAKAVDLPDSYLSRMYKSKYAQHFYTEGELAAFKRSWERPRAS
jgi:hypothetical protein